METRAIHLVPQRRGAGSCLDFVNGFSRRGMFSQKSLMPCAKLSRSAGYLRWNFTVEQRGDEGDSYGRSPRPNCPWGSGGWVGGRQRWWWCKEGIIVRSHRANHEKNCSGKHKIQKWPFCCEVLLHRLSACNLILVPQNRSRIGISWYVAWVENYMTWDVECVIWVGESYIWASEKQQPYD